ncbi:MAG: HAD domain-containing protein [Bacteroidia bacterium]|jgi:hypothetical protein|nr:HAD domain-containing protein [Bacteroidia bacterium]
MLIFLDIDGVMVPAKSWERPCLLSDGFPEFSSKALLVLQNLISDDVTVMLTTSHKSRFNIQEWKEIFQRRGITINNLKTLDECSFGVSRKDEILNWFNLNSINEDFVILDDDKSLNALPTFLKDNLILTSPMVGLTENHLDIIKSKLGNNLHTT